MDAQTPAAELVMAGLVPGLPNEQYHAMPGVSKSGLDHFAKSPAHYQAYLTGPQEETPALRFGRIFHRFILEPDACRLAVWEGPSRSTKAGKEAWAEFLEESSGCEIVTSEESSMLEAMRTSAYAHAEAKNILLAPGRTEISRWAYDESSGELCKCRADKLLDIGLAVDLKSAKDASKRGFAKACAERRYHVQAAFYPDVLGLDDRRFAFVVVEKTPPYPAAVYELEPSDVEYGRYLYQDELLKLADCKIKRAWPAYSEKIERLALPKWATKGE